MYAANLEFAAYIFFGYSAVVSVPVNVFVEV